jgi:hypothetical protein
MLALFLTTSGLRVTNWATLHAKELDGVMIASAVLMLAALGFWIFTKDDPDEIVAAAPQVDQTNSVTTGRDNSGHQIHNAPGGTVIIGDGNATNPARRPAVTDLQPLPVHRTKSETISLELSLELREIVYDMASSAWIMATQFDYENSRVALIAWFTNPVPTKGSRGIEAFGLGAHLKFSGLKLWSEQIKRAYWLGRSENRINLESGDRAGVVVGLVEWNNWVCYSNPYERPAHEEFLQPALRRLGERKSMSKSDMRIEITLISSDSTALEVRGISFGFHANGTPNATVHP